MSWNRKTPRDLLPYGLMAAEDLGFWRRADQAGGLGAFSVKVVCLFLKPVVNVKHDPGSVVVCRVGAEIVIFIADLQDILTSIENLWQ
jgi:hypothetical protein